MELSGFFGSVDGDRRYRSKHWARYFSSLVGNGIVSRPSNGLQVIAGGGMGVVVRSGRAYINGYDYENTENLVIQLQNADGVLSRIDRIVLQWNWMERAITAKVRSSPFATNPAPPALQRNPDVFELCLADVSVGRGITSITQAVVTDQRLNTELCGIVGVLSETIDTEEFAAQLRSWFENFTSESDSQFKGWFETITGILDQNAAGNLLNMILHMDAGSWDEAGGLLEHSLDPQAHPDMELDGGSLELHNRNPNAHPSMMFDAGEVWGGGS